MLRNDVFLTFFLLQHFHILYTIHLKNIHLNYKKKEDKAWNTVTYTDKKKITGQTGRTK